MFGDLNDAEFLKRVMGDGVAPAFTAPKEVLSAARGDAGTPEEQERARASIGWLKIAAMCHGALKGGARQ
jgi:hypothetical protein